MNTESEGATKEDTLEQKSSQENIGKESKWILWILLCIAVSVCILIGYIGYQNQLNNATREAVVRVSSNTQTLPKEENIFKEEIGTLTTQDDIKIEDQIENTVINTTESTDNPNQITSTTINNDCPETAIWNGVACQELASLKVTDNNTINTPIPIDHIIFAAGGYNGKRTDQYIDDSGHNATIFDVFVDYSEKPVVLIFGAYEPSIWNISISKGTRIEKIILGGYYNQEVAGIFKTIPIERHIYTINKSNDYFYISKGETTKGSLKKYGNVEEIISPDGDGKILIGNKNPQNIQWVQDPQNIPEHYYVTGDNLGGKAGLDILVQKGVIRAATKVDADNWFNSLIASPTSFISQNEGYPITDASDLETLRKKYTPGFGTNSGINYYVALQDFKLPGGMYWAYAFYIPKGIKVTGDISNGSLYDYNNLKCSGACIEMHR